MFGYKKVALVLFISTALSGCDKDSGNTLEQLNKNRQIWENQNFSDYELYFSHSCNCLDETTAPRIALIENDVVVSQVINSSNNPDWNYKALRPEEFQAWTVNQLFELIALEESRAESLEVEYNEGFGYPTLIKVDGNKQIADDEYTITVTNMLPADLVSCTAAVYSSLRLTILQQEPLQAIACGVTVTASNNAEDIEYTETFVNDDASCEDDAKIQMLEQLDGFYRLTFEKENYESIVIEDFGIGRGICGPFIRDVTIEMTPE